MASLDDILSAVKNINTALSTVASTWLKGQGNLTSVVITSSTTVIIGSGRLVSLSVLVAGSGAGTINNAVSATAAVAANALCVVPMATGIVEVGMIFNAGLTVVPGTGQSVVVTYYVGQ